MTHILSTRPLTHYRLRVLEANAATADAVGRDIKLAEMLIAKRAHPGPEDLSSASTQLKA